jgi:hypothetical protein
MSADWMSFASSRRVAPVASRAPEQIEHDCRIGGFRLGNWGLTEADELGETGLGEVSSLAAEAQTWGESKPALDQLGFPSGQLLPWLDCGTCTV